MSIILEHTLLTANLKVIETTDMAGCLPAHAADKGTGNSGSSQGLQPLPHPIQCFIALAILLHIRTGDSPR